MQSSSIKQNDLINTWLAEKITSDYDSGMLVDMAQKERENFSSFRQLNVFQQVDGTWMWCRVSMAHWQGIIIH